MVITCWIRNSFYYCVFFLGFFDALNLGLKDFVYMQRKMSRMVYIKY